MSKFCEMIETRARQLLVLLLVPLLFAATATTIASTAAEGSETAVGKTSTSAVSPSKSTATPAATKAPASVLPLVASPYPGDYTTRLVGDEEMRVGRFDIGRYGGTLVRSIIAADPKVFNPWTANDSTSSDLAGFMFSGLLTVDPYTGNVIPDLASSFSVDKDGLTYTTKLRKGLKWSDGQPITADDVAFTWNTIIAQGYGNSSIRDVVTINGKMPTVTTVDKLTNKFVTPKPFAPFSRLLSMSIAPKHIIEPILKQANGRDEFFKLWAAQLDPATLVTCGPYRLKRFVTAQRVELEATNNYYSVNKEGKKLPYLQKLIFLIVPDPNTNLLKFKSGELDNTGVRAQNVPELLAGQQKGNYKLYNLGPSFGTTFVMFNMNRRKNPKTNKPYVDPIKSAWFNDVNFRQAINHAINRDALVANYFRGIGAPLFTAEPPASSFFNKNLKPFKMDLSYSNNLLSQSGFKKGPDGFLRDKTGHKVEFTLYASAGSTFYEATGNQLKTDLAKLGIKVNFQPINFNVLNDRTSESLDWDVVLMSLTGDPQEPNNGGNVWKSGGRLHLFDLRKPDQNGITVVTDARPWEKRLDVLFDQGATTLNVARRHAIYDEYQKIIYDQAPFVFIASPMAIIGQHNTLQNFRPTPLSQPANGLHNIDELWKK